MKLNVYSVIGIDIGIKYINICSFSQDGYFLEETQISSPQPLLPGAVTIEICEIMKLLDPNKYLKYVGVCFSSANDRNSRNIENSNNFLGWNDVPIADWLETRLKVKVVLVNLEDTLELGLEYKNSNPNIEDVFIAAIGAGKLAHQKLANTITLC